MARWYFAALLFVVSVANLALARGYAPQGLAHANNARDFSDVRVRGDNRVPTCDLLYSHRRNSKRGDDNLYERILDEALYRRCARAAVDKELREFIEITTRNPQTSWPIQKLNMRIGMAKTGLAMKQAHEKVANTGSQLARAAWAQTGFRGGAIGSINAGLGAAHHRAQKSVAAQKDKIQNLRNQKADLRAQAAPRGEYILPGGDM